MSNLVAKHDCAICDLTRTTATIMAIGGITITSKPCFTTLIAEVRDTLFANTTHISGPPNTGNRMLAGSNMGLDGVIINSKFLLLGIHMFGKASNNSKQPRF